MRFLFRSPKSHYDSHHRLHHRRTLVDATAIKHVRDRGLDHAVLREGNLKPLLNLKNLIQSEPSKTLPISVINDKKDSLSMPTRPIEFIRKYPSIFQEFIPGGAQQLYPNIKLTTEVISLDYEEALVYQSDSYKQNVADRLLKLLMLSRTNKIPLKIIELLKWDLGLPNDYLNSVVPEFPDYFRVLNGGSRSDSALELVCWSDNLAVSVIEKKAKKYEKGMAIAFPIQFSAGFEIDKDMKKWVDDWQKLPYLSPYENSINLTPNSDESDKWATGVLHELLHLFVGKKVEKDSVLCFGEHLGIRSRFKRALLHHPGIFYLSSKMGTYTVVLREMYKRGLLLETNSLMSIRNQYLHLMYKLKEGKKSTSVPESRKKPKEVKTGIDNEKKVENEPEENDDVDDESDDENEEDQSHGDDQRIVLVTERTDMEMDLHVNRSSRNKEKDRSTGKHMMNTDGKVPPKDSRRTKMHAVNDRRGTSQEKSSYRKKEASSYRKKEASSYRKNETSSYRKNETSSHSKKEMSSSHKKVSSAQ